MKSLLFFVIVFSFCVNLLARPHGDTHIRIAELSKQILEDSSNALLYLQRGSLYLDHGDLDSALVDFNKAILFNPPLPLAHLFKSYVWYEEQKYSDALCEVNNYLVRSASNIEKVFLHRARIYTQTNNLNKAIKDYQLVLKAELPQLPQVYLELAETYLNSGPDGHEKAINCLRSGIERLGSVQAFQIRIIEIYRKQSMFSEAINYLDEIIETVNRKERWFNLRGDLNTELNKNSLAKLDYECALHAIDKLSYSRKNTDSVQELKSNIEQKLIHLNLN